MGQKVDISYTSSIIEIYHKGKRVASHMRVNKPGAFVTDKLHMPHHHRQYLEWTPERIKSWGEKIGPHTRMLMGAIMEHREHPCMVTAAVSVSYAWRSSILRKGWSRHAYVPSTFRRTTTKASNLSWSGDWRK
jgi:hypothetical protein